MTNTPDPATEEQRYAKVPDEVSRWDTIPAEYRLHRMPAYALADGPMGWVVVAVSPTRRNLGISR